MNFKTGDLVQTIEDKHQIGIWKEEEDGFSVFWVSTPYSIFAQRWIGYKSSSIYYFKHHQVEAKQE